MGSQYKDYQLHFLQYLLEGRKEISEEEARERRALLALNRLQLPCFVLCIAPDLSGIKTWEKDRRIFDFCEYVDHFFLQKKIPAYTVLNTYDNLQVLVSQSRESVSDEILFELRDRILVDYGFQLYIGVGSEVNEYGRISVSSAEAFSVLAYKYQYADRGVISIDNIIHFRHNISYGNDEVFNRVIGCFQDGNLAKMSSRLEDLVREVRYRPRASGTSIKRTIIELTVHILHIASDANVDVDRILNGEDPYNWIMSQDATEVITAWFMQLASDLLKEMRSLQTMQEKKSIQMACDYMNSHLCDTSLGLQNVSDWIGLSSSYFSQLFKREKGLGVTNYITKERIKLAKELLATTSIKNEYIALQLGFARGNYFSKVFKKETGYTPGEYRKQFQRQKP